MWIGWAVAAFAVEPDQTFTAGAFRDLEVADFDGDGVDDIAWTEFPGVLWVALGPNLLPVEVPTVPDVYELGAADFDGDGADDLVVVGDYNDGQVHRGGPGGPIADDVWVIEFGLSDTRSLGDIDGNGYEDAYAGPLLLGGPDGPTATPVLGGFLYGAGPLDADGLDDVVLAGRWGLTAHRGASGGVDPEPLWTWSPPYYDPYRPYDYVELETLTEIVALDLDGDGVDELAHVEVDQGWDGHQSTEGVVEAITGIHGAAPVSLGRSDRWESLGGDWPLLLVADGVLLVGFEDTVSDLVLADGALVRARQQWAAPDPYAVLAVMDQGDVDGDGVTDLVVAWNHLNTDVVEVYSAAIEPSEPPTTTTPPGTTPPPGTTTPPVTTTPPAGSPDGKGGEPSGCGCAPPGSAAGGSATVLAAIGALLGRRRAR